MNARLAQTDWPKWRDSYLAGKPLPCSACGENVVAVLSPSQRAFLHDCGHQTTLPEHTPSGDGGCPPSMCAMLCLPGACRDKNSPR